MLRSVREAHCRFVAVFCHQHELSQSIFCATSEMRSLTRAAEFRRRRSLCYAKQSSTTPGTSVPPVFTSPELASGTSGTLAGSGTLLKNKAPPPDPRGKNGLVTILKRTFRATERQLSNLQLAIAELAVLAFLSGVGTVIDQEQVRYTSIHAS